MRHLFLSTWLVLFSLSPLAQGQSRHRLIQADLRTMSESAQLAISHYCQAENSLYFLIRVAEDRYLPLAFIAPTEWSDAQNLKLKEFQDREDVSLSWWWPRRYFGLSVDLLPSKLVDLVGQVEQGKSPVAVVAVELSDQNLRQYVEGLLRKSGLHASGEQVHRDRFIQFLGARSFPTPYATAVGKMDIVARHISRTGALEVEPIWPNWGNYRETSLRRSLLLGLSLPSSVARFPLDYLSLTDKAYLLWDTSGSTAELVGYLTQDNLSHQLRFHFPELAPARTHAYFARLRAALGEKWQNVVVGADPIAQVERLEPPVWSGVVRVANLRRGQNVYGPEELENYSSASAEEASRCSEQVRESGESAAADLPPPVDPT